MEYIAFARPGDDDAQAALHAYRELRRAKPDSYADEMSPWERQDILWGCAALCFGFLFCGSLSFWPAWFLTGALEVYLVWTFSRLHEAVRHYRRLVKQGRIVLVPRMVVTAFDTAAGAFVRLREWEAYDANRREALIVLTREMAEEIRLLEQDCGCVKKCGHAGRLTAENRSLIPKRIRLRADELIAGMRGRHLVVLADRDGRNQGLNQRLRRELP